MKTLLLTVILMISFNTVAGENDPTAKAYKWTLTSGGTKPQPYELAVFANNAGFGEDVGFRVVYRSIGGEWKFLQELIMHGEDDFDSKTNEILTLINAKVRTFFLLDDETPVPVSRLELAEQFIYSGIVWNLDRLVKK